MTFPLYRSPLHWAAKRNHARVVSHLLVNGADRDLKNAKGESAVDLTDDSIIRSMLGGSSALYDHSQGLEYLLKPYFKQIKSHKNAIALTRVRASR